MVGAALGGAARNRIAADDQGQHAGADDLAAGNFKPRDQRQLAGLGEVVEAAEIRLPLFRQNADFVEALRLGVFLVHPEVRGKVAQPACPRSARSL